MASSGASGSGGGVADEFRRGLMAANDPDNAQISKDGRAISTLRSPWLFRPCPICGHSFRPGDPVVVSEGRVSHVPTLAACRGAAEAEPDRMAADFFKGLDETWPPPAGVPLTLLLLEHPLVAPANGGFRRRACAVCAHTFRPYERVVICPCSPTAPLCEAAVHRDPMHKLRCWESWNPGGVQDYCPATSRKLGPPK